MKEPDCGLDRQVESPIVAHRFPGADTYFVSRRLTDYFFKNTSPLRTRIQQFSVTPNISLIGMPGAGKSAVGKALARHLGWDFVDTDRQIERDAGTSLQQLLDERGHLALRELEETHILALTPNKSVISTGGSVVYSPHAVSHLRRLSTVVFLDVELATVKARVQNFGERGIASARGETLATIYAERLPLYKSSADITVPNSRGSAEQAVSEIIAQLGL